MHKRAYSCNCVSQLYRSSRARYVLARGPVCIQMRRDCVSYFCDSDILMCDIFGPMNNCSTYIKATFNICQKEYYEDNRKWFHLVAIGSTDMKKDGAQVHNIFYCIYT